MSWRRSTSLPSADSRLRNLRVNLGGNAVKQDLRPSAPVILFCHCAPQKLVRAPSQLDVTLLHSELPQAAASFLVWKVADCRGVQSG